MSDPPESIDIFNAELIHILKRKGPKKVAWLRDKFELDTKPIGYQLQIYECCVDVFVGWIISIFT